MDTPDLVDDVAERLISRNDVAERLDCSPATVTRMANVGRFLQPMLVGNLQRWRERDVNTFIAMRATATKQIEAAAMKSLEPVKRSRRG